MASSGMLRRVALVRTSFITVTRICELGTMLAVENLIALEIEAGTSVPAAKISYHYTTDTSTQQTFIL
jgi:hypothetical protein